MQKTEVLYEFTVGPWYVVENDFVCWLMDERDWDAICRSCGREVSPQGEGTAENWGGSIFATIPQAEPLLGHDGRPAVPRNISSTELAERMDAERRNLERLGRKVAFWLGTTLIVMLSCAAGWWIGWR